jgi:hypothetical protein
VSALLGDYEAFNELIGGAPAHPGDYVPWLLMQSRTFLWRHDLDAAARLAKDAESAIGLPQGAREAVRRMLDIAGAGGSVTDPNFNAMQKGLPVDGRRTRRRASFNGQLLAEIAISSGRKDAALDALEAADANLLLDAFWVERCPGLDPLRGEARFEHVRKNINARAEAVRKVVESRLSGS